MGNTVQIRSGLRANLPTLNQAEQAYTTDDDGVWIGDGSSNHYFGPIEVQQGGVFTLSDLQTLNFGASFDISDSGSGQATINYITSDIVLSDLSSGATTSDYVPKADGSGGISWDALSGVTPLYVPDTKNSPSSAVTTQFTLSENRALIRLEHLIPATDVSYARFQLSTDGGSNWQATNYQNEGLAVYSDGVGRSVAFTSAGCITPYYNTFRVGSGANEYGVTGYIELVGLTDTNVYTEYRVFVVYTGYTGLHFRYTGGGRWKGTTAINKIKIYFDAGNIESGDAILCTVNDP